MKPWSNETATYQVLQHLPALATAAAVVAAGTALALWWAKSHRLSVEQLEKQRREHLVRNGRTIDGTVLDWPEQPGSGNQDPGTVDIWKLGTLHYSYAISGVTYECAQDLTALKDTVQVDASCLGMPASVRYDPKKPANSIVVAETWNGLHRRQPVRQPATAQGDPQALGAV
ncbi:MAG: hypothetical protein ACYDC6_10485 [Acidobacteriaceae bacterium]